MKKILVCLIVSVSLIACTNQGNKSEATNIKTFKENSKIVQTLFDGYSNNDFSLYAPTMADTAKFLPPITGTDTLNKSTNFEGLKKLRALQKTVSYSDLQFLPTVDATTYKPDGNVRVFATWTCVGNNGVKVTNRYFAIFVFNTAHQVEFIEEYQDMTGIIQALTSTVKE